MKTIRPNTHRILLFFLTCILTSSVMFGTHLVGGSLNYEYLGENVDGTYRYRVFSVTFTDCGATSNFPDPEGSIPVGVYANDLNDPDADKVLVTEFVMPLISFEEVILEGIPDGCDVGANICVERGDYEAFVDLPLNFDGFWLYYDRCCRNEAVVNLTTNQGVGFSTYIPSPLIVNSSPFFSAPPTPFLCAGDTTSFLNSAIDPDGDLLVFSFINPYRGYSTDMDPNPGVGGYPDPLNWEVPLASYNTGYSIDEPFGANGYAFINGSTGLTTYMAPSSGQFSVAVEIKEYRNGNLIGITRRDLQLTVITCPVNPAPDLSEESEGNVGFTEWSIDEGDTLCFPVIFVDDNGDSLFLSSFGEVFDPGFVFPSATINTPLEGEGTVQADFCWETDCDQGQDVPYFFGVTATDNGCPPKSASEVYTIQVIPFTGANQIEGESAVCENSTETYTTDEMMDATYVWTVSGGNIASGDGTTEITVDWGNSGAGSVSVIITNFRGCVGDPFDIDVAIQPLPIVDAGSDIDICIGDTIGIGGAPTGPGGSFFIWGPDMDIDNTGASNPEVFPTTSTDYIVQVISANSCAARDTISVTVNEPSLDVIDDLSICEGGTAQLNASGAETYNWTPIESLDDAAASNPIADPTETTTYTVTSVDANNCEAEAEVTVTVIEMPIAMAGIDSTICGLEIDMYAIPSVGISTWSASPGATVAGSDFNAPATVLAEGTYEFTWTESTGNGLCVDEDIVSITFIEIPTASPGMDDVVCGLEYQLDATPTVGSGIWTIPAGLQISPDTSDPNGELEADDYGIFTLTWTETNQMCVDMADLSIEFIEDAVADAGVDFSICGDSYSMSPGLIVGNANWTGSSDLLIINPEDPNTEVMTSVYGPQVITLTTESGEVCTATDEVTITFVEIPTASPGMDDTVCGLEYQLDATPSVGSGTWTLPAGLQISPDTSDPNGELEADNYGIFTLTWTETNQMCVDMADLSIEFIEDAVADAGVDFSICGDSYSMSPGLTFGTLNWSGSSDLLISNPGDSNTEVTTSVYGPQVITLTAQSGGFCTATDEVVITFNEIPIADAGEDISICGLEVNTAAFSSTGTGIWSGDPSLTFGDISDPNSLLQSNGFGTFTLTWTEDTGDCSDFDEVEVSFLEDPIADAGPDLELCLNSSITVDASGGGTYSWLPLEGLDDPNSESPEASPIETTTYTLTVELGNGCSSSDEMTITVLSNPQVNAGDDISYLCYGDSIQLQATEGLPIYSWSPNSFLSDSEVSNPFAGPFPLGTNIVTYTVTVTDEDYCQGSDEIVLTINPDVPTDAGPDTLICSGSPVLLGADPVSPEGTSFIWSPDQNIDDINAEHPTVTPTETTTYTVLSDNSICTGSDIVTVIVEVIDDLSFEYSASPSCEGLEVQFSNLGDPTLDYLWGFGDDNNSDEFSPSHLYAYNTNYTVTLFAQSDLGCFYALSETLEIGDFSSYFDVAMPNVMTPNHDGSNDVLDINVTGRIGDCLTMQVFNRWGQVVFESTGSNTRWDGYSIAGELAPQGVYFYYVEFNGAEYKGSVR